VHEQRVHALLHVAGLHCHLPAITEGTGALRRYSCGGPRYGTRRADRRAAQLSPPVPCIRERRQKNVDNIIGQCPAIVRKPHWGQWVIGKHVWQQRSRRPLLRPRRIAARVFNSCAKTPMKRSSFAGSPLRYASSARDRKPPAWVSTSVGLDPASRVLSTCEPKFATGFALEPSWQFNHDAANILSVKKLSP